MQRVSVEKLPGKLIVDRRGVLRCMRRIKYLDVRDPDEQTHCYAEIRPPDMRFRFTYVYCELGHRYDAEEYWEKI